MLTLILFEFFQGPLSFVYLTIASKMSIKIIAIILSVIAESYLMWCTTIMNLKDKPLMCQNYSPSVLVYSGNFGILIICASLYQNTFDEYMIRDLHITCMYHT